MQLTEEELATFTSILPNLFQALGTAKQDASNINEILEKIVQMPEIKSKIAKKSDGSFYIIVARGNNIPVVIDVVSCQSLAQQFGIPMFLREILLLNNKPLIYDLTGLRASDLRQETIDIFGSFAIQFGYLEMLADKQITQDEFKLLQMHIIRKKAKLNPFKFQSQQYKDVSIYTYEKFDPAEIPSTTSANEVIQTFRRLKQSWFYVSGDAEQLLADLNNPSLMEKLLRDSQSRSIIKAFLTKADGVNLLEIVEKELVPQSKRPESPKFVVRHTRPDRPVVSHFRKIDPTVLFNFRSLSNDEKTAYVKTFVGDSQELIDSVREDFPEFVGEPTMFSISVQRLQRLKKIVKDCTLPSSVHKFDTVVKIYAIIEPKLFKTDSGLLIDDLYFEGKGDIITVAMLLQFLLQINAILAFTQRERCYLQIDQQYCVIDLKEQLKFYRLHGFATKRYFMTKFEPFKYKSLDIRPGDKLNFFKHSSLIYPNSNLMNTLVELSQTQELIEVFSETPSLCAQYIRQQMQHSLLSNSVHNVDVTRINVDEVDNYVVVKLVRTQPANFIQQIFDDFQRLQRNMRPNSIARVTFILSSEQMMILEKFGHSAQIGQYVVAYQ